MQNLILHQLGTADFDHLKGLLVARELPRGTVLELPGAPVSHAHFLETGFVSVLLTVGRHTSEVGLVGREGMLGVPAVLGSPVASYRAVVREDARTLEIPVEKLRAVMGERRTVWASLLRYMQAGVAQITHTAFANAQLNIPQRLARWLLMAHDRIDRDTLQITHGVLSDALGVRRPGVTLALHELEGEGAIRSRPRAITILDRGRLERRCEGAYGPAERAYRALFGQAFSRGETQQPPDEESPTYPRPTPS